MHLISCYPSGAMIALGYCNGTGLYLPSSRMIPEGGYEVDSFYEYGYPAPLAEGIESALSQGVERLRDAGI